MLTKSILHRWFGRLRKSDREKEGRHSLVTSKLMPAVSVPGTRSRKRLQVNRQNVGEVYQGHIMKVGMGKPGNQSRNCLVTILIFIFRRKLQLHVRSRRALPRESWRTSLVTLGRRGTEDSGETAGLFPSLPWRANIWRGLYPSMPEDIWLPRCYKIGKSLDLRVHNLPLDLYQGWGKLRHIIGF